MKKEGGPQHGFESTARSQSETAAEAIRIDTAASKVYLDERLKEPSSIQALENPRHQTPKVPRFGDLFRRDRATKVVAALH